MAEAANSTLFVVVLVAVDFAITLCHTLQEWKGAGAPLWRNFGAIVGTQLPDRVGFAIFTVLLTLILLAPGMWGGERAVYLFFPGTQRTSPPPSPSALWFT